MSVIWAVSARTVIRNVVSLRGLCLILCHFRFSIARKLVLKKKKVFMLAGDSTEQFTTEAKKACAKPTYPTVRDTVPMTNPWCIGSHILAVCNDFNHL